jgi:putative DNA primase/helicase
LIDRITTEEEKSGLLNLALISLRQLIKDNGFAYNADIEEVRRDYNLNSSTVEKFLEAKCQVTGDENDFIVCRDLWDVYLKYCKENQLEF